ncbi:MAG: YIEGIA domain-containing protein, partial [Bacillota bacterium]|nr:YIEGIA domain-containing protein [Bacillota bacterium]
MGIVFGTIGRLYMLRVDYRMYPSYPHGFITHISLGFIAASLGAVAMPALTGKDYVAVTFLALAAQQFRDIRSMERENLARIERNELVPRGNDYIEGIAKVFETRNYLVMATALITSGITILFS